VPTTPPGTTPPGAAPAATAAQVIITAPPDLRVGIGPLYRARVESTTRRGCSVLTLTITYNPAVLRVAPCQDGLFMRQGGVTARSRPRSTPPRPRDIAPLATGDQTGASRAGCSQPS
jgi:hypothetical protein